MQILNKIADRNIAIGTPCYGGVTANYANSLAASVSLFAKYNINLFPILLSHQSVIQMARNRMLKEIIISDADDLVWIDSDISWTTEQFFHLINSPYEVTTGAYLLTDGTTTIHLWNKGPASRIELLNIKEPLKVQSCGFGFIAMKKGVFERMPRPWFNHEFAKVGVDKNGRDIIDCVGEDISWCIKAYREKIDIWFDPRILVTHNKTMPLFFR